VVDAGKEETFRSHASKGRYFVKEESISQVSPLIVDCGDNVVIINAEKFVLQENKLV